MSTAADVVVIGAGSAGATVAAALAVGSDRRVLLLERGRTDRRAPRRADRMPVGPTSEWALRYPVVGGDPLVRGCGVGGSGAVNGGYFVRARPADLDAFADPRWSFDRVLPWFRAIEHDVDFAGPAHGRAGPIPVRRVRVDDLAEPAAALLGGAPALGLAAVPDLNNAAGDGAGRVPLNVIDGSRIDPGVVLDHGAAPNLRIRGCVRVRRLMVRRGAVTGVDIGSEVLPAEAVVLCAGAVESPAILLRSGIGDPGEVRALGIRPIVSLSGVGRGTVDHPEVRLHYRPDRSPRPGPVLQAVAHADGLEVRPYSTAVSGMVDGAPPSDPYVGVAIMAPAGRGRVTLDGAHSARVEAPRPAYAELARARALGSELLATPDWRAAGLGPATTVAVGTSQHLTGSCALGDVVDTYGRLHGVAGVWVADASVIPVPLSRGPHATVIAVATRIAHESVMA
ncbi:GMC family oxidoreductase N-terminal domain-containing protein [Tsukamurella paurometabola]|uniref:GMC family oxidoreductase N-terminal domain-containing protein n=1 Tax=Tsukamurella paurometabola TaxID=2061 RepID=A0ABS5NCC9_TSUPA|nr:GMC family oxidoreductase N-terminal domain-containing protein [Tsukamurella paurometabola]MBS4101108.1 GMC family oxidoreductase N-terminal domain-containing protein [Tsukamurella paurometabola]